MASELDPPGVGGGNAVPDAPRPRKRRRKAGDLGALRRVMWRGLEAVEAILNDAGSEPGDVLRAAHAVASLGGAYVRAIEAHDLVPRLEQLEREATERAAGSL